MQIDVYAFDLPLADKDRATLKKLLADAVADLEEGKVGGEVGAQIIAAWKREVAEAPATSEGDRQLIDMAMMLKHLAEVAYDNYRVRKAAMN